MSDTWNRVESMQTEEIHLTLERELGMISQKACELVNQTIMKTIQVSTFGGILLEDMELDTSSSKRGVSMMRYPSWATYTEDDVVWWCPVGGRRKQWQLTRSLFRGNWGEPLRLYATIPIECAVQHGKVLVADSKTRAKSFLHLCQRELDTALETLKRDYNARILDLTGTAKEKLLKVLRGLAKDAELQPLLEDWEKRIRNVLFHFSYLSSNSF